MQLQVHVYLQLNDSTYQLGGTSTADLQTAGLVSLECIRLCSVA